MDFVFKIDKDINCIKKVGTKIYFGASGLSGEKKVGQ